MPSIIKLIMTAAISLILIFSLQVIPFHFSVKITIHKYKQHDNSHSLQGPYSEPLFERVKVAEAQPKDLIEEKGCRDRKNYLLRVKFLYKEPILKLCHTNDTGTAPHGDIHSGIARRNGSSKTMEHVGPEGKLSSADEDGPAHH